MENKQVKKVGGGVNRSTSIDLQSIERDVATLVGRAATTPISMKALYDEVRNLKGNLGRVEILEFKTSGSGGIDKTFTIPANNGIIVIGYITYERNSYTCYTNSITNVLKQGQSVVGTQMQCINYHKDRVRPMTITNNGSSVRIQHKDYASGTFKVMIL